MTNFQKQRLREKLESKVIDIMDGVIDTLDIDNIIDDDEIAECINDRLCENLKETVEDMIADIVDDLM